MRQLLLVTATTFLLQTTGWGAACMTGSLANYIALGAAGCTLGNLQVSHFAYSANSSGGAAKITADEIAVTPLLPPMGTFGLQFAAPWSMDPAQSQ